MAPLLGLLHWLLASAASLGLAVYVVKLFVRWSPPEGKRKLYAPLVGTLFHQLFQIRRYYDYHTDLSRKHRTYRLVGPAHDEIFTVDPLNCEYILKTNFANFGKGWLFNDARDLLGDGIFAVDGGKWRHQRKLASFEFSTKVLRDFSTVIFKKNAARLAHVVAKAADNNEIIDIQDWLMKSTMDSIFKIAVGVELNNLSGTNNEGTRLTKAFDDSSALIRLRFMNPAWRIGRFLNIGPEAALKENAKVIDEFLYKQISTKIDKKPTEQDGIVQREDILSRFLLQAEQDPENMNDMYLKDVVLNFIIAGKETTGGTLSWFLYMLCKHPSVQERIAKEITEATESDSATSFEDFAKSITEEAANKMHYLHAALSETLRFYPPIPTDAKVCFSDDKLPDGYNVRKGDVVTYLPYAMGRMEFIWGEDAEVFRPERWLDDNGVFCQESPFKFTAFQAGPRICIGKEFAYRQMKVFASVLLRFFTFRLGDETKPANYRTMLTLHVNEGLYLCATRR